MANHRVFVSYARTDAAFTKKLASDLKAKGVNIWLDTQDIRVGSKWDAEIQTAIDDCDCLLVIISPTSAVSDNVLNEISSALADGKRVLPVKIADCKLPLRINRFQFVDMSLDYDQGLSALSETLMPDNNISSPAHDPSIADANERAVKATIANWQQKGNNGSDASLSQEAEGKQPGQHGEGPHGEQAAGRMEQFAPLSASAAAGDQKSKNVRKKGLMFAAIGGLVAIVAVVLAITSRTHPHDPDNSSTMQIDSAVAASTTPTNQPDTTHLAAAQQNSDAQPIDNSGDNLKPASVKTSVPDRKAQPHAPRPQPEPTRPDRKAQPYAPRPEPEATRQDRTAAETTSELDRDSEEDAENATEKVRELKAKYKTAKSERRARTGEIKRRKGLSRSERDELIEQENKKVKEAGARFDEAKKEAKEANRRR